MSISVEELKEKMDNKENIVILDVREEWERVLCKIEGSLHILMGHIMDRVDELPKKKIIVYCHTQNRSRMVADFLVQKGLDATFLKGGIDMWAEKIEPGMERY